MPLQGEGTVAIGGTGKSVASGSRRSAALHCACGGWRDCTATARRALSCARLKVSTCSGA
eukprot:14759918-Alexandrium_andersonii.AAC.1